VRGSRGSRDAGDRQRPAGSRRDEVGGGGGAAEPVGPRPTRHDDDLAVVVRRDVGAGVARQHGERLVRCAAFGRGVAFACRADRLPQPGDGEQRARFGVVDGEQPLGLAPGGGLGGGEFVEAVDRDQAAALFAPRDRRVAEAPPLRPVVVHRLAAAPRPAPPPLDELVRAVVEADDRGGVGDADAGGRGQVRQPLGEGEGDLELGERLDDFAEGAETGGFVAHGASGLRFCACKSEAQAAPGRRGHSRVRRRGFAATRSAPPFLLVSLAPVLEGLSRASLSQKLSHD
jgi:hypothetical protein